MIHVVNPEDCCGCTACENVCPKQAISMKPDALGFLYPNVNEGLCVNCGLCEKVCSFNQDYDKSRNFAKPLVFGARHKDMNQVASSRSGAAFIAFSDWILGNGGVVYGAGFADHFRVVHKRAETKVERDEFKGSKYVQSDLGNTFKLVKEDLKNGLKVMYSGTPCQIAGLKSYIGDKHSENLFLVDIVCHGVPSPYIWRDYLRYVERKYRSGIVSVQFRDKSKLGWKAHKESFCFENGKKVLSYDYTYLFYQHIMLRQSCKKCPFANTVRPADITLADFWGWEKTEPTANIDDKGLSLLLINTSKGELLLNQVSYKMDIFPAELSKVLQPNLMRPTMFHDDRNQFEKIYCKNGFKFVSDKYGATGFAYRTQDFAKRLKNKILRLLFVK